MNSKWGYSPETLNLGQNWRFFVPCDLEMWRMTLKNNRAPLLCYFKLCASFHSHPWIQNGVTVRKRQIWVKIGDFLSCVTLTFDLWPWPFAWISRPSMVITPENFRMIRWQKHCQKGVTDGWTYRRTEIGVLRAAWSQLKNVVKPFVIFGAIFQRIVFINTLKAKQNGRRFAEWVSD